jgi:hypothetical protein
MKIQKLGIVDVECLCWSECENPTEHGTYLKWVDVDG